jgi:signal transduction histidine kinase
MWNKLSTLQFHDKIFIAYGFIFLVMFGVVFGSTSFLIRLAFKREIDAYVETLRARISNNYQAFLNKVEKDVHATATDERLLRAIEREAPFANILTPDFDLFEYGTADGKRLYPNLKTGRNPRTYNWVDNEDGHIQLRYIPQQIDLGLQLVVQVTESGEWGFVTGGYRLQTWLETTQTSIQSDEHPIFLVGKPQTSDTTDFSPEESENWLPLNNAARDVPLDNRFQLLSGSQLRQKVTLDGSEETEGSTYTASRITPFNSAFATTRETPPVDLIVAYSHARQMKWQRRLTLTLLLSGVVGLVLVYLISYIISRRITRPIATLREGVSHIAAGNLDHRVVLQSHNEIGQLADGFNRMARDLKLSLEERMAAERAATWRDVARQVAHEIKNPLFPIRLSVENLQQAKSKPEVFEQIFKECTDTVIEEVDRIGKLIDGFHQFAQMPKPEKKSCQLNDIVRSILTLYTGGQVPTLDQENESTPIISGHENLIRSNANGEFWLENISKIQIETELQQLPQLLLDPKQIAQVLGNLLKNAIEAMPDGGTLKVKTYFMPSSSQNTENSGDEGTIHTDTHGTVSLEIHDTGHGMSDETMANLFVPYFTTKSETDGRGLGIPIVRQIVAEHGAEIDFQSTEGVGTTVRIRFSDNPSERSEALTPEPEELTPLTDLRPKLETEERSVDTQE